MKVVAVASADAAWAGSRPDAGSPVLYFAGSTARDGLHEAQDVAIFQRPIGVIQPARISTIVYTQDVGSQPAALVEQMNGEIGTLTLQFGQGAREGVRFDGETPFAVCDGGQHARQLDFDTRHIDQRFTNAATQSTRGKTPSGEIQ